MRTSVYSLLLLLVIALSSSCGTESRVKRLKLAHGLPTDHPVHQGMVFMADRLQEISGNRMAIDIYPSEQLGSERQCLELLQIGSLSMTKVSAAVMENFAPNIRVMSLPYIFRSREHAYNVLDGEIGRRLLIQGEEFWLRGLTYFDAGMRSFYTKDRPINKPEDVEGLKIRVQESKTAINLVRSLGGAPTPISYGELYTALQQGVVDGAENNPPSFYTSRHYEVCKYYSLNEHTAVPDILVIGTVAWNSLDEQEQQWLQQAADEAKVKQRVLWAEAEAEALAAVQEAGVEVIRPDKTGFMEKTAVVLEEYKDDPSVSGLIREIQAVE
ncbi:TRAP transporter substrate-binding protein [Flavilitoribacter nigricans]|uniref:TRAP transporter substrate-binding protein DctP n=1 Tax=Flavilitoribacter nigricans (strain ATCC 23147 / DSM 23189 / NBRC 102662 / NCIMB 1420 / SS-2) TaxID=1122177 RepID=A0A2D0NB24_FLAN2|nr:TRAP transporter substrate-binding protein [Flavilitoribacter nigricans]PHN05560.1 TRAP transporter substrate-binding protein DctP [Flavilitoribacter nigricans DSM 23189 = NBRC 102662]